MKCRSCNSEIFPELKHAIAQNVCPFCGNPIMDEETLALIEDLEQTISAEITLREGSARKLAISLVAKYEISGVKQKTTPKVAPLQKHQESPAEDADIINVSEMEGIDPKTREQIFEQVVREKYNMVDQVATETNDVEDEHSSMANILSQLPGSGISDKQLDGNPKLEQERLFRLAKQQQALKSGSGSVHRSG